MTSQERVLLVLIARLGELFDDPEAVARQGEFISATFANLTSGEISELHSLVTRCIGTLESVNEKGPR